MRIFPLGFLLLLGLPLAQGFLCAEGLKISNRYSPLNRKRPVRPETKYIILHTTEGGELGSLREVRRYGETHYFLTPSGRVYRIIERNRIATHAGRSMWRGTTTLDNCSIGIEVVGHYDRDITPAQYDTLRELLRQLKSTYGIDDDGVLTHSMVAYGRPNRFHPNNHRGRKRCGMIFARDDVRARLGLAAKPAQDVDVAEGRLKVADPELFRFLFAAVPASAGPDRVVAADDGGAPEAADPTTIRKGITAWTIARDRYDQPETTYILPDGERLRGDEVKDWSRIPAGTRVVLAESDQEEKFEGFLEIGKDGASATELAGDSYASATTIYFFPGGLIRTGLELQGAAATRKLLEEPPQGTRLLVGYTYGGYVHRRRPPSRIAGSKWNYPSTFYRLPDGRILSGDEIDAKALPERTLVFYQN